MQEFSLSQVAIFMNTSQIALEILANSQATFHFGRQLGKELSVVFLL